jgi:hypothetical protein
VRLPHKISSWGWWDWSPWALVGNGPHIGPLDEELDVEGQKSTLQPIVGSMRIRTEISDMILAKMIEMAGSNQVYPDGIAIHFFYNPVIISGGEGSSLHTKILRWRYQLYAISNISLKLFQVHLFSNLIWAVI